MRLPYAAVEFTKNGEPADSAQVDRAIALVKPQEGRDRQITDVLVLAHGWNNDMNQAERLFTRLADNVDLLNSGRPDTGRRFAVIGVLWPSIRWADEDQIAGGGLSVGDELAELRDRITESVEDPQAAAELSRRAAALENSPQAREEFVAQLRTLLPDATDVEDDDALPDTLRQAAAPDLFALAAEAEQLAEEGPAPEVDDAALPPGALPDVLAGQGGAAAGFNLRDLNPVRAARLLLNTATYYTMKDRAGKVGSRGVAALLNALQQNAPAVRVHLAGHSFGARVVSMAAATTNSTISSVTLLQGAFSHRGFARKGERNGLPQGAFRRAVEGGHVRGPIVVTHTHNDKAVGIAYAVASRLARQASSGLGDANDPYGGLGANGAVGTEEAVEGTLGDQNATYTFEAGKIYNLRADTFIANHGDVTDAPAANALLQAMTAAG